MNAETVILGGGIAGLSLASFLEHPVTVLEREQTVGGLSRSYSLNGVFYDIGPHIVFSKNKEVLDLHTSLIPTTRIRRSNQIFFKGRYVKYPFENDLAALDPLDRDYCLNEFLANPYEGYKPENMLQSFLSVFGEGITKLYLQPYNEKIWKFDPAFMDMQMVERIPKPPKEDVIQSAKGIPTEGYTHQLYFHYPTAGGFQSLVDAYRSRALAKGSQIETGVRLRGIRKLEGGWRITTDAGEIQTEQLLNCMPIHELFKYLPAPEEIASRLKKLLYNSIYIVVVQVRKDRIGDHFALYIPERDIIFHRLSKLNFLGQAYQLPNEGSTLMAEVTFRPGSYFGSLSQSAVVEKVIDGLVKLGFVDRKDVLDTAIRVEEYAYVIYDLDHRQNVDTVLNYLKSIGIMSLGRFAEFEYLNTDGVVERTLAAARTINPQRAARLAASRG
jgi:protoporphyrinogen oxidase